MRSLLALLALTALVGCATNQVPATINIPIAVPCKVEEPNAPTYRFTPPYTSVFEATRDLLGDREVALAYQNELLVALKSCK